MSDRFDRIERILDSFVDVMADLKTKQEITQRQIDGLLVATERIEQNNERLISIAELLTASNTQLTQVVTRLAD